MKFNRKNKLIIGLCTAAAILIMKLFSIQIIEDKYKMDAENNSMVYSIIYPTRGIIHDRNGRILVGNKVAYDHLAVIVSARKGAISYQSSFEELPDQITKYFSNSSLMLIYPDQLGDPQEIITFSAPRVHTDNRIYDNVVKWFYRWFRKGEEQ